MRLSSPGDLCILRPADAPLRLAAGGLMHCWGEGAWYLQPRRPAGTDHLVLSAGVHGDETAPIEILEQLFRQACAGDLEVRNRTLLLIGNPPAVRVNKRFMEQNLNRLFGRRPPTAGMEPERAAALRTWVRRFFRRRPPAGGERVHYDMHSAIRESRHERFLVCPYGGRRSPEQLAFWSRCGVHAALFAAAPASTFSHFSSSAFGASAFTVELGRVCPLGANDMRQYSVLSGALQDWIAGQRPPPTTPAKDMHLYRVVRALTKSSPDWRLNLNAQVANFTPLQAGFSLADDVAVEADGDAIVFPNDRVPVGQRAGLLVRRTTLSEV